MKQRTYFYNNMKGYKSLYYYIRRRGKVYATESYFRPDVVRADFDKWIEGTGRERVYVKPEKMDEYISLILKHYIVTEKRYNQYKKDYKVTNEYVSQKLGYSNLNSFHTNILRWIKIEYFLDNLEDFGVKS